MIMLLCLPIAACRRQWKWPAMWQWLLRVIWVDNLVQWILASTRLQRVIWLRLRVIWPATVEWVPLVMPLVAHQLAIQVLRRHLMLRMPLLVLRWTVPPPKVARLVLMQEPEP